MQSNHSFKSAPADFLLLSNLFNDLNLYICVREMKIDSVLNQIYFNPANIINTQEAKIIRRFRL